VTCENEPVLVFDGDCGFCTSSARWIEARLPADTAVEPWQSLDLDSLGLTEAEVTAAAYWVDDEGSLHRGHLAIGRALVTAGGLWGIVGRLLVSPPLTWVARPVYALVARYRYKLPGATDACRLPD
jgi:predicted DCC family thiol-disulfide oxidoreductase YuxK